MNRWAEKGVSEKREDGPISRRGGQEEKPTPRGGNEVSFGIGGGMGKLGLGDVGAD